MRPITPALGILQRAQTHGGHRLMVPIDQWNLNLQITWPTHLDVERAERPMVSVSSYDTMSGKKTKTEQHDHR